MIRIGHGMDVHRLVEGRKLILCGVEIPHTLGLLGHSDADVAAHALMDALLGAAALGDIGKLFPDTDERYRGADSLVLLDRVMEALSEAGCRPVNADVTIVAQSPSCGPISTKCGPIWPPIWAWTYRRSASRPRPPKEWALRARKRA